MRVLVSLLFFFVQAHAIIAQPIAEEALLIGVEEATTYSERLSALHELAHYYYDMNLEKMGDRVIDRMILEAEKSGDRVLIQRALYENPCFELTTLLTNEVAAQKKSYAERALEYARRYNDLALSAHAYIQLSNYHLHTGDLLKADYHADMATNNANLSGNDSAIILSNLQKGEVSRSMSKVLDALQKYSNAQDLAIKKGMYQLESKACHAMANLYKDINRSSIGREMIFKSISLNKSHNDAKGLMGDYMTMAKMCERQDGACQSGFLEEAKHLADSLNDIRVIMSYKRLKFYAQFEKAGSDSMKRVLASDTIFSAYFKRLGPGYLDWLNGQIFLYGKGEKQKDSAIYFLNKAKDALFVQLVISEKKNFLIELAAANSHRHVPEAIRNYEELLTLQKQTSNWSGMAETSKALMTLFESKNDFKKAYAYGRLYEQYNSVYLDQSRKNDIELITLENDRKEKARLEEQALAAKRRAYNLQYLAIGIFIFTLFIILSLLGFYRVSVSAIRMVGFFSFISFFEFITLLSKKWMTQYTQGIPWQDFLFLIGLAFVLLPLHHRVEHWVIMHLTRRQLIRTPASGDTESTKD
jgi:hypothetical protein